MNVRATLAAAVLGSLLCQAAVAGPVVATKWRITGESRNECKGHAQEAIKRAGFESAGSGSESMMGRRGEYTAAVRCVTEQRFVFVAHELEGRSFKDLAAETGLSVNTLLARKHYAVRRLRRRLQAIHEMFRDREGGRR